MRRLRLLPFFERKPSKVALTRAFVDALNARDFAAMERMLTPTMTYRDTANYPIGPRERYLEALRRIFEIVPDMKIVFDSVTPKGSDVLCRGRIVSDDPAECVEGLWKVTFHGDQLCKIHSYREGNARPLRRVLEH
ncbi:nuclear transport factor 2 family protein [Altererythrobacter sp. FM1]|uniref:Nuclear transport factor 2 family protein n=1 Tax=Tsuneonella flava TaxID=2055955 RepID=A0ABX7K8S3_9SPHN|nr:nuclear transport factor 2 family protein [Tsuneonella flava]QSB43571.1 nuclear transport factor 2 family protein [Tsuneonella flava]ROT94930.1 nuclear transport factor 2 family protein [Altererythrobacter sp. FM1]